MKKTSWITLVLLAVLGIAQGQEVRLGIKQKGKTRYDVGIQLSDIQGNAGMSAEKFIASEMVYFIVSPTENSERTYFKESDLEDELSKVSLWQESEIPMAKPVQSLITDKKISRLILTYAKKDLLLWEPMYFKSEVGQSDSILLPETYFNDYEWFASRHRSAGQLLKEKQFEEALAVVQEAIQKGDSSTYFAHMSFFDELKGTFPLQAVSEKLLSFAENFSNSEKMLLKEYKISHIQAMEAEQTAFEHFAEQARWYADGNAQKSAASALLIKQTRKTFAIGLENSKKQFALKKISLLEKGRYDQYQFRLFVDLIYQKIVQSASFSSARKVLNLDKTLTASERENLQLAGWEQDFEDLLYALKVERAAGDQQKLFSDSILANLQDQMALQPKPYFEVFSAANSAAIGEDTFVELIREAMLKVSSETELQQLELMMICYPLNDSEVSEAVVNNLNNGMKKLREEKWKEADFCFELAIRQQSQFAPAWFYLGQSEFRLGEVFSSQARIDQALNLLPGYISPRLFSFGILSAQGDYAKILEMSKIALQTTPAYLLYLWKAKAHFQLKQYKETVDELTRGCIALNPNQEEAYFLLGDTYLEMKKFDLAREAYQKTQAINPFETSRYNEKMGLLPPVKQP